MRRLATLAVLAFLGGCTGSGDDTAETDSGEARNYTREAVTDGGSWEVAYAPSPDPIPMTDNFTLEVTVSGPGAPSLAIDARMPQHNHGMNTDAVVSPAGDGTFGVQGMQFHMPGHWAIHATVTDGDVSETATFDVECCEAR